MQKQKRILLVKSYLKLVKKFLSLWNSLERSVFPLAKWKDESWCPLVDVSNLHIEKTLSAISTNTTSFSLLLDNPYSLNWAIDPKYKNLLISASGKVSSNFLFWSHQNLLQWNHLLKILLNVLLVYQGRLVHFLRLHKVFFEEYNEFNHI